jgi:hypothetical protein
VFTSYADVNFSDYNKIKSNITTPSEAKKPNPVPELIYPTITGKIN